MSFEGKLNFFNNKKHYNIFIRKKWWISPKIVIENVLSKLLLYALQVLSFSLMGQISTKTELAYFVNYNDNPIDN